MIYALVGLPGAGKTTYSSILTRRGVLRVSGDDLRSSIHAGEYVYDAEIEDAIMDTLITLIDNLDTRGRDVVVDESLLTITAAARRELESYLSSPINYIVVDTPLDVCKARRRSEPKGLNPNDWDTILDRHAAMIEYPENGTFV